MPVGETWTSMVCSVHCDGRCWGVNPPPPHTPIHDRGFKLRDEMGSRGASRRPQRSKVVCQDERWTMQGDQSDQGPTGGNSARWRTVAGGPDYQGFSQPGNSQRDSLLRELWMMAAFLTCHVPRDARY